MRKALSVLLAAALVGCGVVDESEDAGIVTVTARRVSLEISVPAKGYLEALNASPIAVPRVPTGALKVKELAEEGALVEPGDVVVVFDDTQLSIDLENHKASFLSTDRRITGNTLQAQIESGAIEVMRGVAELERDHADAFQLEDEAIYSRQEILETEVQRDNAQETIVFADASLMLRGEYYDIEERILGVERGQVAGKIDRTETSLGNLVLRAPLGGLVLYKKNWRGGTVAVGDNLWPGNVILSIVDPGSVSLTAFLLERDAAGIQKGAAAEVRVDARPGQVFAGKVDTIAELSRPIERGSPVKYFEIKVALEEGVSLLRPGMKGEARIRSGAVEDAIVIPRSAVRGEGEQLYVLVEGPLGTEKRDVRLGIGDQVQVVVEQGLDDGERVLLGVQDESGSPDDGGSLTASRLGG